jgi:hypothetical protein
MSEATIWSSGYAYTLGNPIKYIDLCRMVPTGPTDDCTCISGTEIADGANKAIAQHNANLTAGAGSNGDWNRGGGSFGPNLEWTRRQNADGTFTQPIKISNAGGDKIDYLYTLNADGTISGESVDVFHGYGSSGELVGYDVVDYGTRWHMQNTQSPAIESVCWECWVMPVPKIVGMGRFVRFLSSGRTTVPLLRASYEAEVKALSSIANEMRVAGASSEKIARHLHGLRRELGVKYKSLTPDNLLQQIYQRNIEKYGDKLGPTINYLRQQGKSWDDIINSAIRPGGSDIKF